MFGISPEILYSSLERTERFDQENNILGGVRSSEYKFALVNRFESGMVDRTEGIAQANQSLEGVCSSGYEFARANYFESGKVE